MSINAGVPMLAWVVDEVVTAGGLISRRQAVRDHKHRADRMIFLKCFIEIGYNKKLCKEKAFPIAMKKYSQKGILTRLTNYTY